MSDKLHHRRKAANLADLARQQAKRAPYDKVLIVCEGTKTEPNYLIDIINELKLSTANVEICSSPGSDPLSVVDHADNLVKKQAKQKHLDNYDRVFCVFDKDEHELHGNRYTRALEKVRTITNDDISFTAITSVPCFEVWLLLHFERRTAPFSPAGKRTAAKESEHYLCTYLPDYTKGSHGIYQQIKAQTNQAIAFAKQLEQENQRTGSDNPSTKMHQLVEYLLQLKSG